MAGNWIKISKDLDSKPEVIALKRLVGASISTITYHLLKFWSWADGQTQDGTLPLVTADDLDEVVGRKGFASALVTVGWLIETDGRLTIPNFERHNGESAKKRALAAYRQRKKRDTPVTLMSRNERDTCVTRGDKRRLDKNSSLSEKSCSDPATPTSEPVVAEVVMSFPLNDKSLPPWELTAAKLSEYVASFPAIDVMAECLKARQWCIDNAGNRKTPKGMPKFLSGWLGRAQDRAPRRATGDRGFGGIHDFVNAGDQ